MSNSLIRVSKKLHQNVEDNVKRNCDKLNKMLFLLDLFDKVAIKCNEKIAYEFLEESLYDVHLSIMALFQNLYKNAFSILRNSVENSFAFIYYTDRYIDYLKWKKNKQDISWCILTNYEKGIISNNNFFSLFSSKEYEVNNIKTLIENIYRTCSEYVHGKSGFTNIESNPEFEFNEIRFECFYKLFFEYIEIILLLLILRFPEASQEIDDSVKERLEQIKYRFEVK